MGGPPFGDTIAAIATPSGRGAIAVLRVSGPDAGRIARALGPAASQPRLEPRVQRLVAVHHPETGELLDRALVTWFPGPASFTGEDVLELSTHGGTLGPQLVLDAILAAGARPAEPGEFTRRAVLNGKIDVLQAEAIADLIDGHAPALHRAAIFQMERGLTDRIAALRSELLRVEALVSYGIDFPEEDEPPVPAERVHAAARATLERIAGLLATSRQGEMLREGALVVLAGRPNSGKSSLFNALLGSERAIVTEIPGTTRDAVEAPLTIDGYPFRLVDTAGLRDTEDVVEGIGIEVARRYLAGADVVLFCHEAGTELSDDELAFLDRADPVRTVLVRTKVDLSPAPAGTDEAPGEGLPLSVGVSVRSGVGLPELGTALLDRAFGGILGEPGEQPLITRARHARALRRAEHELRAFLSSHEQGVPPEFAATHLRAAADALELLIGAVTPDDVLGEIFGAFCVGK